MSYEVCMMGNNFELLDHIRVSRVTAGGMFRIFYHILLFVWKNHGWNGGPSPKNEGEKNLTAIEPIRECRGAVGARSRE